MEKDANGNDVLLGVGTYGRVGFLLVLCLHSHLVVVATQPSTSDTLQGKKGPRSLAWCRLALKQPQCTKFLALHVCTKDCF